MGRVRYCDVVVVGLSVIIVGCCLCVIFVFCGYGRLE